MAKNKINFGLITKLIVLVLCVVTAVSFFLPVFGSKEESGIKYSNCMVCFLSEEKAVEKAQEYAEESSSAALKGNNKEAEKLMNRAISYELITSIKDEDFGGRAATVAGAWFHFAAMVASVVAIAFVLLTLFGKDFAKISIFATIASAVLMIVALICGISFLATEIGSSTVGEEFAFRFGGVILGLITSILATAATVVPCLIKKKKSK